MSDKPIESTNRITIDHEEIRKWAEGRSGKPAKIKDALHIYIGEGKPEENTEEIPWEIFFEDFEKKRLAFLYHTDPQNPSFEFISRD
jgi:hypothetical protein